MHTLHTVQHTARCPLSPHRRRAVALWQLLSPPAPSPPTAPPPAVQLTPDGITRPVDPQARLKGEVRQKKTYCKIVKLL